MVYSKTICVYIINGKYIKKRTMTQRHRKNISKAMIAYHSRCRRCVHNNNKTRKLIENISKRQEQRMKRIASIERKQKERKSKNTKA